VDTTASTVTIQTPTGTVTLTVTAATKIKLTGVYDATLADLLAALNEATAAGTTVTATAVYDPANNQAALIIAKGPAVTSVQGQVTAVDQSAMTVTLQTSTGTVTLNVTATTKLVVNRVANATLADLQAALDAATAAGNTLTAKALVYPTTGVTLSLKAQGPPPSKVYGPVTAVDESAMTVTIQGSAGAVTLNVTSATRLKVNDVYHATLADLSAALADATAAGTTLFGVALYDTTTLQALFISAEEKGGS
jgi:hypothetical protein